MAKPLHLHHKIRLDWATEDPERVIARHARVSTKNPDREEFVGLLKYCIKEGHISIFEQVSVSFEIITTRSISPQILRHRSFCFQEASQRYCDPTEVLAGYTAEPYEFELRKQDKKNRQNSLPFDSEAVEQKYRERIKALWEASSALYHEMLEDDVAKECARNALLPCTPTRLHMCGNLRDWLFYVGLRLKPGTQREHRYIAWSIAQELMRLAPVVTDAARQAAAEGLNTGLVGWLHVSDRF